MDLEPIILAVGALGGLTGLAALLNSLTRAQDSSVQRLQDVVDVLSDEVVRLRERVSDLEDKSRTQAERIACLERKVAYWKDRYNELDAWVREKLNIENDQEIIEEEE